MQIEETWVDHRTFGLSMGVNGYISKNVINMMCKAIMSEQRDAHFLKHVFNSELGVSAFIFIHPHKQFN